MAHELMRSVDKEASRAMLTVNQVLDDRASVTGYNLNEGYVWFKVKERGEEMVEIPVRGLVARELAVRLIDVIWKRRVGEL